MGRAKSPTPRSRENEIAALGEHMRDHLTCARQIAAGCDARVVAYLCTLAIEASRELPAVKKKAA